jgi:Cu-processing system ATP-binding protein
MNASTAGPDYRTRIGYMPQFPPFPENLTPREILSLLKNLRGAASVDESLVEAFHLEPELDKPVRVLSGGNRQKVSAVAAFLFRPEILILDEPTAGLDPVAGGILKDRIRSARLEGRTILLTSHIMSEIEELADDLIFLLDGRVRYSGTVGGLQQAAGHQTLERAVAHLMSGPSTLLGVAA